MQKTINRVLPQIKIDLQTLLASNNTFIEGYTQTFRTSEFNIYIVLIVIRVILVLDVIQII